MVVRFGRLENTAGMVCSRLYRKLSDRVLFGAPETIGAIPKGPAKLVQSTSVYTLVELHAHWKQAGITHCEHSEGAGARQSVSLKYQMLSSTETHDYTHLSPATYAGRQRAGRGRGGRAASGT